MFLSKATYSKYICHKKVDTVKKKKKEKKRKEKMKANFKPVSSPLELNASPYRSQCSFFFSFKEVTYIGYCLLYLNCCLLS